MENTIGFSIASACYGATKHYGRSFKRQVIEFYRKAKDNRIVLHGTVTDYHWDPRSTVDSYLVVVPNERPAGYGEDLTLCMPLYESHRYGRSVNPEFMKGNGINFYVTRITKDNEIIISHRAVQEDARLRVLDTLKQRAVKARVAAVLPFGAFLRYGGARLVLRNKDFSLDHTPASEVLKQVDFVTVKLTEVSDQDGSLYVEPVVKYRSEKDPVDRKSVV